MANDSSFNATEIYEDLTIVTQLLLFNTTVTNGSLPNGTQVNEGESNSIEICNKTVALYPSTWDAVFTTEVLLNCIVCILGILGNVYALSIIFRSKLNSFIQNWRKSMAICDLLLLICDLNQVTVARIGRSFLADKNYSISLYSYVWVLIYPLRKMIETASIWITVSVVIERCIFMYHPRRSVSLCKDRLSGILFLFIAIFAASINFPRFREYKVRDCYDVELNVTSIEIWKQSVSDVIADFRWVLNWIYLCAIYIVPFLILVVSNSLLWRAVREYQMDSEKSNKEIEPEVNFVRMVVCFTVVFCVCKFPKMVEEVYADSDISVEFMTPFSNLMLSMNSAVNFVIYTLF